MGSLSGESFSSFLSVIHKERAQDLALPREEKRKRRFDLPSSFSTPPISLRGCVPSSPPLLRVNKEDPRESETAVGGRRPFPPPPPPPPAP